MPHDGFSHRIVRIDVFQAAEDQRMMGHDHVGTPGRRFTQQRRRAVEADHHAVHLGFRTADAEAGIVPGLLSGERCECLENRCDFLGFHRQMLS